jgi:hypothetical protein
MLPGVVDGAEVHVGQRLQRALLTRMICSD